MRQGFTTGSCAAAGSKAAAFMLLLGTKKEKIEITTPKGKVYNAEILDIVQGDEFVSCAVRKDGGDDPDVTHGTLIYSKVSFGESDKEGIFIDGGLGVGRVTKVGLDQPVGNAAINHVPREMIEKEVREVCRIADFKGSLNVEISVPEGEMLAKKTFNPRLGIVGGISIIGTSGIVEPMSAQALIDTIKVEIKQQKLLGREILSVSPGNYGLDFMKNTFDYDIDKSVKCSNFIGETVDIAIEAGFERMLFTGHIGKIVKIAGGIMNTHSREADSRMEILAANAALAGADIETVKMVVGCFTTEEALYILKEKEILEPTMKIIMDKILFYLQKRGQDKLKIECITFSKELGLLGKSDGAEAYIYALKKGGLN